MKILSREPSNFTANTEVWMVQADAVDSIFRLLITTPHYPGSPDVRPCGLIGLDGDLWAGALASCVNAMASVGEVPPTVIVSIAYPLASPYAWLVRRNRDLSPTRYPDWEDAQEAMWNQPSPTGGADSFLSFIEDEVKPQIEESYGVDSEEWTLDGLSLAGLFTLHALLSKPGSFRRYNVVSPSLWWERPTIFDRARQMAAQVRNPKAAVFLAAGDQETREIMNAQMALVPEPSRSKLLKCFGDGDMTQDVREMAKILGESMGLKVNMKIMENETHMSIHAGTQSQGLRWLHAATAAEPLGWNVQRP